VRRAVLIALLGAIAWLYAGVVRGLVVQWATSPDASYGAILAGVGALLLWQRRHALGSSKPDPFATVGGLALLTIGLGCYLAGQLAADVFATRASFVLVAGGLLWFLSGSRPARAAVLPLLFLLLAIPLPELLVTTLTGSLQAVATRMAETILTSTGTPVYRNGNVLELPTSTLQVVEACSGMRSVVSLGSVGVLLAWASDGTWRRRAALIAATTPIAVLINACRLAAIGAASEAWGPAATRDPWHSLAGWMTFTLSLLMLWVVRRMIFATGRRQPRLQLVRA
jgi:exosortase